MTHSSTIDYSPLYQAKAEQLENLLHFAQTPVTFNQHQETTSLQEAQIGPSKLNESQTFKSESQHFQRESQTFSSESQTFKSGSQPLKRKRGRPERQEPFQLTEVPAEARRRRRVPSGLGLSRDDIDSLKFRRMRDLNNVASKRCRERRKNKMTQLQEEMFELEERNRMLKEMIKKKTLLVEQWKMTLRKYHINFIECRKEYTMIKPIPRREVF
jgi:hypothetical protein